MSKETVYTYDRECDILYISFSPGEKAETAVELSDNILLRFSRSEKRAVGLTLMDFSVLVQSDDLGPRSYPLTGLGELEPSWKDTVIEIITKPPVSQILRISVCTPSLTDSVPIAFVEKPPIPIAA